jgi:hypothetical protein
MSIGRKESSLFKANFEEDRGTSSSKLYLPRLGSVKEFAWGRKEVMRLYTGCDFHSNTHASPRTLQWT